MNNDSVFLNKNLLFEFSAPTLTDIQIENFFPFDFKGKDKFIEFYLVKNGGYFTKGAYLYRDVFFDVSQERYKLVSAESFYFIPPSSEFKSKNIRSLPEVWELKKKYSEKINKFSKTHFPFASDAGDNDFWIDIESGYIKYIRWESDDNPESAINVAPSFYDFCTNLQAHRRININK